MLLVLVASAAPAQTRDEPSLNFTLYGGLSTGGTLWNLSRQPLLAPGGPPPPLDTVTIGRRLRPSTLAGLSISWFRSPHFALTADIAYLGFDSEELCHGPALYHPDPDDLNRQACNNSNGGVAGTSVVGFMVGGTYRLFPLAAVQPYLRATGGLGLLGSSYIETAALVFNPKCGTASRVCPTSLLEEQKSTYLTWVVSLSLGSSFRLSPGTRILFEARNILASLPVVTGPRNPFDFHSFPTTSRAVKHQPAFLVGLEILLERRHGRRY